MNHTSRKVNDTNKLMIKDVIDDENTNNKKKFDGLVKKKETFKEFFNQS